MTMPRKFRHRRPDQKFLRSAEDFFRKEEALKIAELSPREKTRVRQMALAIVAQVDLGRLRVAEPTQSGWQTNAWVKRAILTLFATTSSYAHKAGVFEYWDKIPVKQRTTLKGVRVVPGAVVRYGSFVEAGAILMPSFVNIGAWVGAGTMVDTWATVGSCAQIGTGVHLSGGVGIGGVLEPAQAQPVIVEDNAFIGSRCVVVEGAHIGSGAVLGAGVTITSSTKIIDVTGSQEKIYTGMVPPNSVVIPGSVQKQFSAGSYGVNCALIIGQRKQSTDLKTSLNAALRDFQVSV